MLSSWTYGLNSPVSKPHAFSLYLVPHIFQTVKTGIAYFKDAEQIPPGDLDQPWWRSIKDTAGTDDKQKKRSEAPWNLWGLSCWSIFSTMFVWTRPPYPGGKYRSHTCWFASCFRLIYFKVFRKWIHFLMNSWQSPYLVRHLQALCNSMPSLHLKC